MVELKDSRTINGFLQAMDRFMNLKIKNAVITLTVIYFNLIWFINFFFFSGIYTEKYILIILEW